MCLLMNRVICLREISLNNLSQMLTFAMDIPLANSNVVNSYKEKWEVAAEK